MKIQKNSLYVCVSERFFCLCLVYMFESLDPLAIIAGLPICADPIKALLALCTPKQDLEPLQQGSIGGKTGRSV